MEEALEQELERLDAALRARAAAPRLAELHRMQFQDVGDPVGQS